MSLTRHDASLDSHKVPNLIDWIFSSPKCSHFSPEEKRLVLEAYTFAGELHHSQERRNKKPYISHIDRSVQIYLKDTISSGVQCDSHYLIALILHDCIEDCEKKDAQKLVEMYEKFGEKIWIDVLRMSEPSEKVIEMIRELEVSCPKLYTLVEQKGFIELYNIVEKNNPDAWLIYFNSQGDISPYLVNKIQWYWQSHLSSKWEQESDKSKKQKIYGDLIFLAMVAALPRELFRIKATERRDNMQDYEGLLNKSGVYSALKTITTTEVCYLPRAIELGLHHLAIQLLADKTKEMNAFITNNLIPRDLPQD